MGIRSDSILPVIYNRRSPCAQSQRGFSCCPDNSKPEEVDASIPRYVPQSGEMDNVGTSFSEGVAMSSQQITAFADQDSGWTTSVGRSYDSTMDLANNSDSILGSFLGRPIRQSVTSWVVGQPFFLEFNPWDAFITNPFVAEKLAQYELFRCTMNMKIVISGTGFHYGRVLVSYNPLSGYDDVTTQRNFLSADLVAASQRPHFFLNPTNNEGGEMEMPFFFFRNFMSLSKNDYQDLGRVTLKSITDLSHANGGDDPVTVTIYLWATDVALSMPTSTTPVSTFVPQAGKQSKKNNKNNKKGKSGAMNSGDEYGQGIISAPASAIAKAAGVLANIPFIAPYARATEMVASGVGKVANIFGYSRPPIVTDTVLQKPSPTGNLANTDAPDAVNRLTLDSKQEITIDSRTVGLSGEDQMSFKSISCRESFLTTFSWTTSSGADAILWNSYVTPELFKVLNSEIHCTPMAYLAQYFSYWQGSITFRFQVIKSNFHKGRLLLRWDPRSNGSAINYNTVYSRVVDIAEEDDFEVTIGWGQNAPFLRVAGLSTTQNFSFNRLPTDDTRSFNGVLEVNVLNALVSPALDTNIDIAVYVKAGEDMRWGAPSPENLQNLHLFPEPETSPTGLLGYVPQAGESPSTATMEDMSGTTSTQTDRPTCPESIQDVSSTLGETDMQMQVFFGEEIVSLREIFRRYTCCRTWFPPEPQTNTLNVHTLQLSALPYFTGWDTDGVDVSLDPLTLVTLGPTVPLSYFVPCYGGWRGGLRKKLIFAGGKVSQAPVVTRSNFIDAKGWVTQTYPSNNTGAELTKFMSSKYLPATNAGSAATNLSVNNTIETEVPFYNAQRFESARQPNAKLNNGAHKLLVTVLNADYPQPDLTNDSFTTFFQDWSATGEDFTLFFWTGTPILYKYAVDELS